MNRKYLLDILSDKLSPFLNTKGFKWVRSKEAFIKKTEVGFLRIGLYSYSESGCLYLEPALEIRIDRVEEIYNNYALRNPANAKDAGTIAAPIYMITGEERFSYRNCDDNDINLTAKQIQDFMIYEGLGFFEKNQHIEYTEKLFNRSPDNYVTSKYFIPQKAFYSVILAKLQGRKQYNELVSYWEIELSEPGTPPIYLERFKKMKDDLEKMDIVQCFTE